MKSAVGRSRVVACIVGVITLFAQAMVTGLPAQGEDTAKPATQKARLVEFSAPGAATVSSGACAPSCGTVAYANNDFGVIVGFYTDANIVPHGFLRAPSGHITSFDAPGAGLGSGLNQGTVAYAINDLGVIAGQFQDSNYLYHGFVRYPNDSFTTFDEPDAGTGANQGTFAFDINLLGTTAGIYIDGSGVDHGFVRSPSNEFTSFDPTGSVFTFVCEETCLTLDGTVAGFYSDSSGNIHGFMRQADRTITSFDAPAPATLTTIGTIAGSINQEGVIAGYSLDSNFVFHGFVRHRDGSFTTFDDPNAGSAPPLVGAFQGTTAFSINFLGATTGQYFDASNNSHGFERFPDGQFANFDAPDAAPGSTAGTRPSTNNAEGEVAGWYIDASGLNHGFIWTSGTPRGYAISLRTPGQNEAASPATIPNAALRLALPEGVRVSMQRQTAMSRVISRLPIPEKVRALVLKRALGDELEIPVPQPR